MIPVKLQPEPKHFEDRVRKPGMRFLEKVSHPTQEQWKKKAHWQKILPCMRTAYNSVCAYSAHWIPHSTGNHSVDHFIPKTQDPSLAYEWTNFRYVSVRFNGRKGTRSILDPFKLLPNWFILNFKSFFVKPNPNLSPEQQESINQTIEYLKLNEDDDLVNERVAWCSDYRDGHISFTHLKKRAPFIAHELERQGLLNHN